MFWFSGMPCGSSLKFVMEGGMVDSYYFDTQKPESKVVHFDSFSVL